MKIKKYLNALFMITLASISCSKLCASSELISLWFSKYAFKAGPTAPIEIAMDCGDNILPIPAAPELTAANQKPRSSKFVGSKPWAAAI